MVRYGCNTEEPRPVRFLRWTNLLRSCWEHKADCTVREDWSTPLAPELSPAAFYVLVQGPGMLAGLATCQFSAHTS